MGHIHELIDFTSSGFILHPTQPKILLIHHKKLQAWIQPGGHIELNEDPDQTLWREMLEETGLAKTDLEFITPQKNLKVRDVKVLVLPWQVFVYNYSPTHKHIDLAYLLRAKTEKVRNEHDASHNIGWFSMYDILTLHKNKKTFANVVDISKLAFDYALKTP